MIARARLIPVVAETSRDLGDLFPSLSWLPPPIPEKLA
ncbi:hypothetical protein ACCUM_3396 [Candidatus Accumulibacter phosphatis]|uniref:Uncharacterized protein n=1 Tax=Candidatus Accumulibacter phosphatis TaxID=327160 RepID=A0A5S4EP21_9PROT|nr:hypothetical protein ACCUM_3396 [Candidatus Accumulibacter phosphatis]